MAKKNAAPTKSQIVAAVAAKADLSKKQVNAVLESLGDQIKKSLKSNGVFTLPGLCKMRVVKKAATKPPRAATPSPVRRWTTRPKPPRKKCGAAPLRTLTRWWA